MTHAFVRTPVRPAAVYRQNRYKFSAALMAAMAAACGLSAQTTFTKADNTTALNLAGSYTGNSTVPTSLDTILIANGVLSTSRNVPVDADMSISGINMQAAPVSNAARNFSITGGTGILTIGAGGITKAGNTSALTIANTVALSANQTWTINSISGTGTGNFVLNTPSITTNGYTVIISGAGRTDITRSGDVILDNAVKLNTATVVINSNTTVAYLGNDNAATSFQIVKGRAIGSSFGNFGQNSSFGSGGTNSSVIMGGGTAGDAGFFEYTGVSVTSNRTFNFDRRISGSEIRNTNAGSTLELTGAISNNQGTSPGGSGVSAIAFGGAGNIALSGDQQIKDNTDANWVTTVNKNGTGTLTITGVNSSANTTTGTYQGATNVNAGTLVVGGAGSINSSSGVSIAANATFRYDSSVGLTRNVAVNGGRFAYNSVTNYTGTLTYASGTLAGTNFSGNNLTIGANQILAPGNSTGTMNAGVVTWANGGAFEFEINNATGTAGSAAGWDLLNPASLNITAGVGQFTINLVSLTAGQVAGAAQNFNPNSNYSWLFVDSGSAITSFSASSFVLSTTGFSNAFDGSFSIVQGTGLDTDKLYINYASAIPEPSSFAILAGLGAVGFVGLRRRRSS